MKKFLLFAFWLGAMNDGLCQEVLHLQNGSTITVQNGTQVFLQGGITLENGSLLVDNGTVTLKNNSVANQSDWKDNSFIGALGGSGLVIFKSNVLHQYWDLLIFITSKSTPLD